MSRMDPYCRVRVGHSVYETPTCANGSKEPKWNKTFACYLFQGIKNMDIEIYDECTFSTDPEIARGTYVIPDRVIKNQEVADEWLPLTGQEGEGKEGMIHVILSLQQIAPGAPLPQQMRTVPNVSAGGKPMQYTPGQLPPGQHPAAGQQQPPAAAAQQRRPLPQLTDEELEEFVKMFPNLDKEIIVSVHAASGGDKESMVNNLLQLGQQ
jgi:toll-interacting protein